MSAPIWKPYRAFLTVIAIIAAGLAWRYGPQLVDALRFKRELDRYELAGIGPGQRAHDLAQTCGLCHGLTGNSRNDHYPSLAGQPAAYLADQLNAFATDQRTAPQMQPLALQLSPEEREQIAAYYASLPPSAASASSDMLKPCTVCHGDKLQGTNKPIAVPRLAGQGREYLIRQLEAYRSGRRVDPSGSMSAIARTFDDVRIQSIAEAIAGNPPAR